MPLYSVDALSGLSRDEEDEDDEGILGGITLINQELKSIGLEGSLGSVRFSSFSFVSAKCAHSFPIPTAL